MPSALGSAWKDGTETTVNSGTKDLYSAAEAGLMNMLRAKWLCQASSVTTRTGRR